MSRNVKYIIWIFSFISIVLPQRDFDEELKYQNKSIESLKKEMEELQKKIEKLSTREESTAKRIIVLEKEIALTDRLISELEKEKEITRDLILETEKNLQYQEDELDNLRERYRKRAVYAYTRGRPSHLEKMLSTVSWRQSVYRKEYLKTISTVEKNIRKKINSLLINIGQDKLNLEAGLRKNISLNKEKSKQKKNLKRSKSTSKKELASLSKNKVQLSEYLKEKDSGLKELEKLRTSILEDKARFEREERIRRQQEALKSKQFSQLKGQLPWPIDGKVVTKFGRQYNPKLKTTTEYPGVDIQGKTDMPVQTVLNGIVATITYLRGYGTTVIIDHGGGFYTVYSQLKSLKTHVNSEVRSGDVIAHLAESNSENGAVLHFEIWGDGQKLNPEKWLAK
jgi:septal ring factor EnvC (AmiA/AmiB activator)